MYQIFQFISNNSIDLARGCLRGSVAKQCNSMGAVPIHFHFLEAKAVHQKRTWCSRIILAIQLQHGLNGYDRTIPLYVCKTQNAILHHIPNQCSGEQKNEKARCKFEWALCTALIWPPAIWPELQFAFGATSSHFAQCVFQNDVYLGVRLLSSRSSYSSSFSCFVLALPGRRLNENFGSRFLFTSTASLPALLPLLRLLQLLLHLLLQLQLLPFHFSPQPPTPVPAPSARSDNSSVLTHEARYSSACCVH